MPSADAAFLVVMAGLGAIMWELARPRLILPGVLGAGALAGGFYLFWEHSPQRTGVAFLLMAALLFSVEMVRETHFVSGALGTVALCCGFYRVFGQPGGIDLWLVIPLSLLFGSALMWSAARARRARWNKAVDV